MSDLFPPRVRLVTARYGRELAVACVVLGVVALVAAGAVVATSDTDTVTESRNVQTVDTGVDTSAVVTDRDSVWEYESELENQARYLVNDTPVLTVTPTTRAPEGTEVTHRVALELRAVADEETFWRNETVLVEETTTAAGGTARTNATVDVRELDERLENTSQRLSNVGSLAVRLHVTTTYDTGDYAGELTADAPFRVTENAYWVDGDLSSSRRHSTPVTRETEAEPDYGLLLSLFGGSVGAFAVGAVLWRGREDAVDVGAIREEIHRRRHDEWISCGSIPMWVDKEHVQLDTLEDVVDVAIDGNQRVIYDQRSELYAVIDGDMIYYYSREGSWDQMAWPDVGAIDAGPAGEGPAGGDGAPGADAGAMMENAPDPDSDDAWEEL
ncbi:DUF5305 domain-containing protein [Halostella litorea]|uniref:DUF5305 domain-containing protein n=1 Tax=Halostella litorea TaxID=2528831 RepID=UPI0010923ACF|nr:DUF5305 domain-containing protein [Halostella litorea]